MNRTPSSNRTAKYPDIPNECPECERAFAWKTHATRRPPLKWSLFAIAFFCAGIFIVTGLAGVHLLIKVNGLKEGILGLKTLFIAYPAALLFMCGIAYNLPRIVKVSCNQCGWFEKYETSTSDLDDLKANILKGIAIVFCFGMFVLGCIGLVLWQFGDQILGP